MKETAPLHFEMTSTVPPVLIQQRVWPLQEDLDSMCHCNFKWPIKCWRQSDTSYKNICLSLIYTHSNPSHGMLQSSWSYWVQLSHFMNDDPRDEVSPQNLTAGWTRSLVFLCYQPMAFLLYHFDPDFTFIVKDRGSHVEQGTGRALRWPHTSWEVSTFLFW